MEEEESDYESSDFWKEKHDNAISALESCEKSKQLLEKHNAELRRRDDEMRARCENLTGKIGHLTERCKEVDQDVEKLKHSKHELSQRVIKMESELSSEREKVKQCERNLGEKETTIKLLIEEGKCLKEAYGKNVSKSKALEEFGKEVNSAKENLESQVLLYEMRIAEKEKEIEQLELKIKTQSASFEELQETVADMMGELNSLRDALEENRYKRAEISQSLIDLRKNFTDKNDKLAEECYSQALDLERAYTDCEAYCRKIEELESTLAETQKDSHQREVGSSHESMVSIKSEEFKKLNGNELATKNRLLDLEDQVTSYRQEIQNLRTLISDERSRRQELEEQFERKDSECRLYLKKLDERNNNKSKEVDGVGQDEGASKESRVKIKQVETGEVKDSDKKQEAEANDVELIIKKNEEVERQNGKLTTDLSQLREEYTAFVGKNEGLKAENERLKTASYESKADSLALQSSMEKLKQDMWKFHESVMDAEAEKGGIEKLKSQCNTLKEEKKELIERVDDLTVEKGRLLKDIEEIKQSMWQRKHDMMTVPHSIIEELERTVMECRIEKESMMRKAEQMETEHKQRIIDSERNWTTALAEKENFYQNQLKKTEASEFLIRRLEDKLRQKEVQFDVKKGEIKRVLLQYSDLKNEKIKCEKKIESMEAAEKTFSTRIQALELKLIQHEQQEKELIRRLDEKEIEKRRLIEDWGKAALEGVNELKRAMIE